MQIELEHLRAVGAKQAIAERWLPALQRVCMVYDIITAPRIAAFLAQTAHESIGFAVTSELWGPTPAQQRYEGRKDLGNTQPGDGSRFRGHGLIQITGRANHVLMRDRLRKRLGKDMPDFEQTPKALAEAPWAAWSAGEYWAEHQLNWYADAGDFKALTRRINGGLNGYADRLERWLNVRRVMGTQP